MEEAGDFFLDGDDELVTIRGFKSILCLDLLGIPCVVFGGEECVDSVFAHDVGVGGRVVVVGGEDGRRWVSDFHDLSYGGGYEADVVRLVE